MTNLTSTPANRTPIEFALENIKGLLQKNEHDAAMAALRQLEADYIAGAVLFDLIGDGLLSKGEIALGIKYKTLFEVIRGTFRILKESNLPAKKPAEFQDHKEDENDKVDLPMTYSMGQECMRQGHFDKAFAIFSKLLEKDPQNLGLLEAADRAKKKKDEKKTLDLLKGWLENIDKLKTNQARS